MQATEPVERWWLKAERRRGKKGRLEAYLPRLDAICAREAALARAGDGELAEQVRALRGRARSGEPLDALVPELFALVRETARRALGERPYEVQLLAGTAMHEGKLV